MIQRGKQEAAERHATRRPRSSPSASARRPSSRRTSTSSLLLARQAVAIRTRPRPGLPARRPRQGTGGDRDHARRRRCGSQRRCAQPGRRRRSPSSTSTAKILFFDTRTYQQIGEPLTASSTCSTASPTARTGGRSPTAAGRLERRRLPPPHRRADTRASWRPPPLGDPTNMAFTNDGTRPRRHGSVGGQHPSISVRDADTLERVGARDRAGGVPAVPAPVRARPFA